MNTTDKENTMADGFCDECVNHQLVDYKRQQQKQEEINDMLYSEYLKENDRLVNDQKRYIDQLQREKAEYYKEAIQNQIYQKNQQKHQERQLESQNQYQPICENTFQN